MSDDPYVYPHTEMLKNKFGERDEDSFRQIEADCTGLRFTHLVAPLFSSKTELSTLSNFGGTICTGPSIEKCSKVEED